MTGRIVTLVGADGAGKSTHARRLADTVTGPATYIYMGSNPQSVTHSLPTTRAWTWLKRRLGRDVYHSGPPHPGPMRPPRGLGRRLAGHFKSLAVVALRASEELYRLGVAESLARRGHLVVLDRHPYLDYHQRRLLPEGGWLRWGDRLHAVLLQRVYPHPSELVLLDAPAEILHARKPEGSLEALRARRQEYLDVVARLSSEIRMTVLDVTADEQEVATRLLGIVEREAPRAEYAGGG